MIGFVTVNLVGTIITTTAGDPVPANAPQALRYAAFNTIALHTGTGFCSSDYDCPIGWICPA